MSRDLPFHLSAQGHQLCPTLGTILRTIPGAGLWAGWQAPSWPSQPGGAPAMEGRPYSLWVLVLMAECALIQSLWSPGSCMGKENP